MASSLMACGQVGHLLFAIGLPAPRPWLGASRRRAFAGSSRIASVYSEMACDVSPFFRATQDIAAPQVCHGALGSRRTPSFLSLPASSWSFTWSQYRNATGAARPGWPLSRRIDLLESARVRGSRFASQTLAEPRIA